MSIVDKLFKGFAATQQSPVYDLCATLCDELADIESAQGQQQGATSLRKAARAIRKLGNDKNGDALLDILKEFQPKLWLSTTSLYALTFTKIETLGEERN